MIRRADEGARAARPEETPPLRCQAPHPDLHIGGADVRCGATLGYLPEGVEFVGTASKLPVVPELGDIWVRCTNRRCGRWNRFRKVGEAAA